MSSTFYLVQQIAMSSSARQCTDKGQSYWIYCSQFVAQFCNNLRSTNRIAKYTSTEYETPCSRRRKLKGCEILIKIIININSSLPSHSIMQMDSILLGQVAASLINRITTFRRDVMCSSSGVKIFENNRHIPKISSPHIHCCGNLKILNDTLLFPGKSEVWIHKCLPGLNSQVSAWSEFTSVCLVWIHKCLPGLTSQVSTWSDFTRVCLVWIHKCLPGLNSQVSAWSEFTSVCLVWIHRCLPGLNSQVSTWSEFTGVYLVWIHKCLPGLNSQVSTWSEFTSVYMVWIHKCLPGLNSQVSTCSEFTSVYLVWIHKCLLGLNSQVSTWSEFTSVYLVWINKCLLGLNSQVSTWSETQGNIITIYESLHKISVTNNHWTTNRTIC
jgi:hypothetical protein